MREQLRVIADITQALLDRRGLGQYTIESQNPWELGGCYGLSQDNEKRTFESFPNEILMR